jgi:F0F1-type ATP synthase membrane subunit c/vacuolar-type H+-ATPase subunit K
MSQFEYLAIAFSLLYSLAALRIIGGLAHAALAENRSAEHLIFTKATLFLIAISFWVFFGLVDVRWTFIGFLIALMIPASLYYCAAVSIPEDPADVESWRDYWVRSRSRWSLGLAVWAASAAGSATVNLGMGLAHPARVVQGAALTIGIVGMSTTSDRVYRALGGVMVLIILMTLAAQLDPTWLTHAA